MGVARSKAGWDAAGWDTVRSKAGWATARSKAGWGAARSKGADAGMGTAEVDGDAGGA